jgi:hypothetical protein
LSVVLLLVTSGPPRLTASSFLNMGIGIIPVGATTPTTP